MDRTPRFYMALSLLAAVVTMGIKFVGYLITGSVGLFSDAAESTANLLAALIGLWAVRLAARPADEEHAYGHTKSEYFASGAEGTLILAAAVFIIVEAIPRLFHPQPLEQLNWGIVFSVAGAAINGGLALLMLQAGKRLRSVTLQADAHHLLTDVWTTVGVLVALVLVLFTGWLILDPLIALLVAANIIRVGLGILHSAGLGLLDTALPPDDLERIQEALEPFQRQGVAFHALRTRRSGSRSFASLHVLVPGDWTVQRGHALCEEIELAIDQAVPGCAAMTHLEAREDPAAWNDQGFDR
ncbi:cation diffusion facilitator family transporter [Thermosporothrix hazakensis]|jgi:cation diffusion facilitator family transporter|uniref:Cation diffusion facilitator family transporter n=2 Tax=Thermosporothrix TaxID=768650 RepID=A0A326UFM3_THEHA|nr:cation diffusion facilitator family transporter [Thermosporothrix hazakensis]PZW29403.1 cation diffusion facilitator family transporter [Thermosporothrix hazakensis]BBH85690.1 transporter [Thermosporothrix sp. COM3]GCE45881.1 transporter [Thermosporothrix hazakensis]